MSYIQLCNDYYINTLSNVSPYIFFPISILIYTGYYSFIHKVLQLFPKYQTYDKNRQYYIIFNISKSNMLMWITYSIFLGLNRQLLTFSSIDWSQQRLYKNITALYAITDIAPLFINRNKMMSSTIIHHLCVAFAYISIVQSDLSTVGLSNAIIVYGLFSSMAFIVNFYLGFRYVITSKTFIRYLKKCAFINYISACSYNWSVQTLYLLSFIRSLYLNNFTTLNIQNVGYISIYISFLYFWISDDIILMKHLLK